MSQTRLKDVPLYLVYQTLSVFFFLLPRPWCLCLGRALGRLAFHLDPKHRRLALRNLRLALGSTSPPAERYRIARSSFAHFGQVMADLVKWPFLSDKRRQALLRLEGGDNLRRALKRGRGALIFTAHFGNWEVAAFPLSRIAVLNVIARELDNKLMERQLLRLRHGLGARVIYKNQAARRVLQALQRNEITAILIDQNVLRREGVFVDFFGRPASTTPALAAFHLRTGAPLVPLLCSIAPGGSYCFRLDPPLVFQPSGSHSADILKITQHCTKIIENQVRENPRLWLWFHDRWRSRPEEDHG
jgi:KDO2-lipid IV(A) lauroyltransferase